MSCYLGMLLFISVTVYGEQQKFSNKIMMALRIAALIIMVLYYFSLPPQFMTISTIRFVLFALVLHLLISFAPFIQRGAINGFWQYNKTLFLKFLTAALYSVVLYLGLALAILAVDKLFNANINSKIYLDLWIILTGIFNTWFFLSGFPSDYSSLELKKDYPKGLKIFTQYVLLPLVTIYLVILYAYMIKIIVTAQWPVGWVSYLVIGFSITGILSLLLIYPIRNEENNKWILLFSRFFYFALFPLVILLFLAVKRRISDYGITEQRYFVLILALWLLFIAVYFLFSKSKNIKVIPISLCLLALASSFGPWGAFSVSSGSQKQHFKSLLQKYSMLNNGKIVPSTDTIAFKDHKQISSIINYLVEVHGYKTLQPYFSQNLDSVLKDDVDNRYDYTKVNKLHSLMNLSYIPDYQRQQDEQATMHMNFYSNGSTSIENIEDYDYLIWSFEINGYQEADSTCKSYAIKGNNLSVCFDPKKSVLELYISNAKDSSLLFDLVPLFNSLQKDYQYSNGVPAEKMTITGSAASLNAKIRFNNISFEKTDQKINRLDFGATIFIKKN